MSWTQQRVLVHYLQIVDIVAKNFVGGLKVIISTKLAQELFVRYKNIIGCIYTEDELVV